MTDWQATASIDILQQRAQLLSDLRRFFVEREILEVETPQLSNHTVTDVHLKSFSTAQHSLYLQTSPEYAMKRLLAGGSGSIYQICKCFRDEEQSSQHNPEFTMAEWYRVGFTLKQLMDEVETLIVQLLDCDPVPRFSYRDLFLKNLGIDPHTIDSTALQALAHDRISISADKLNDTDYLQLLMTQFIEPTLPAQCFVYDYPLAQAALAIIEEDASGVPVARRFELYCGGMEIANGYAELTDADQQRQRFEEDHKRRAELGLPAIAEDQRLLDALDHGLPPCAGVALGVDRLLMVMVGADSIDQVISFPSYRA